MINGQLCVLASKTVMRPAQLPLSVGGAALQVAQTGYWQPVKPLICLTRAMTSALKRKNCCIAQNFSEKTVNYAISYFLEILAFSVRL